MRGWMAGCLAVLAAWSAAAADAQVAGGWSKVSVKDAGVVAAARFAVAARQAEGKTAGDATPLALEEIVDAEQQVVAGMNYRVTIRVKVGDDLRKAEATVWSRPWLDENERNKLTAWRFIDEAARARRSPR